MQIGILTGGGDAPGLNAAIRGVARSAFGDGVDVLGVRNGWAGLVEDGDASPLHLADVSGILARGGTILRTSRVNPLADPERDGRRHCEHRPPRHRRARDHRRR